MAGSRHDSRVVYVRSAPVGKKLVLTDGVQYLQGTAITRPLKLTTGVDYPGLGGAFNPASIAGLQVWLRADRITGLVDTDPMPTWTSSDSHAFVFAQTDATAQPVYRTNQVNGFPAVVFDATDFFDGPAGTLSLTQNVGGFTVIAAASSQATSQRPIVIATTGTSAVSGRFNFGPRISASTGGNLVTRRLDADAANTKAIPGSTWVNNVFAVMSAIQDYTNALSAVYANGTAVVGPTAGGTAGNTENTPSQVFRIGGVPAAGFTGAMAEVLIFNVALSTADRQLVERYLGQKYGIAVA